jgi:uncharacterized integral membrane protein
MRGLSLLFLLVVLGALVVLGYQNDQGVTLTFFGWAASTYLWVVVAAGYLLGMLGGWTIAGVIKQSWRRATEPRRS